MMKSFPVVILVAAILFWIGYFYTIDQMIMEGQGLPVSWNMMPK